MFIKNYILIILTILFENTRKLLDIVFAINGKGLSVKTFPSFLTGPGDVSLDGVAFSRLD